MRSSEPSSEDSRLIDDGSGEPNRDEMRVMLLAEECDARPQTTSEVSDSTEHVQRLVNVLPGPIPAKEIVALRASRVVELDGCW